MPVRKRVFRFDPASQQIVEVTPETVKHIPRYPLPVEALAVHPDQIGEVRQFDSTHGVPTDYRPDGTPVIRDAGHYRRYRKLHGVHFRNGFES